MSGFRFFNNILVFKTWSLWDSAQRLGVFNLHSEWLSAVRPYLHDNHPNIETVFSSAVYRTLYVHLSHTSCTCNTEVSSLSTVFRHRNRQQRILIKLSSTWLRTSERQHISSDGHVWNKQDFKTNDVSLRHLADWRGINDDFLCEVCPIFLLKNKRPANPDRFRRTLIGPVKA